VVKTLRYKSEGPGIDSRCCRGFFRFIWQFHCATSRKVPGSIPGVAGVFSVSSGSSMCPGVDSASKNEYQVNPGGKVGRCVRLTTYHLHVPMSRNLESLTSWNTEGLFRPVMGQLYLSPILVVFID
jgi:hypothetical protein